MIESDLVITKTANGFMIRSFSDVQNVAFDESNTYVFPDFDTMSNFLRTHYENLDKEQKSEQRAIDEAEDYPARPLFKPEESA